MDTNQEPGNQKDRAWFADLTPEQQERVRVLADTLYAGLGTRARAWRLALMDVSSEAISRTD